MIKVYVNRETCQGYGNCVLAASDIFDLGEDGLVLLKQDVLEPQHLTVLRQAAYDCPTESISFTEDIEATDEAPE